MSKFAKLVARIKSKPKDFAWDEAVTLLKGLDFIELQGDGSRVKFYHKARNCLIHLHKPHPAKILKSYVINEILNILIKEKLI